ncbi:hypothetical protein NDU88_005774 [Pleurodeles waltl]|uniref:Uncharacterized protein n=1 Tax=Pleurodeles waltl TaxID=8319 RepID=A0AAV7NNE0_PLEWA|nr:hypothetical protein NDU88_005774 [Pleurodeles waltl]
MVVGCHRQGIREARQWLRRQHGGRLVEELRYATHLSRVKRPARKDIYAFSGTDGRLRDCAIRHQLLFSPRRPLVAETSLGSGAAQAPKWHTEHGTNWWCCGTALPLAAQLGSSGRRRQR